MLLCNLQGDCAGCCRKHGCIFILLQLVDVKWSSAGVRHSTQTLWLGLFLAIVHYATLDTVWSGMEAVKSDVIEHSDDSLGQRIDSDRRRRIQRDISACVEGQNVERTDHVPTTRRQAPYRYFRSHVTCDYLRSIASILYSSVSVHL
jgi:hypothetical protein